jgi:hypothetical protein
MPTTNFGRGTGAGFCENAAQAKSWRKRKTAILDFGLAYVIMFVCGALTERHTNQKKIPLQMKK